MLHSHAERAATTSDAAGEAPPAPRRSGFVKGGGQAAGGRSGRRRPAGAQGPYAVLAAGAILALAGCASADLNPPAEVRLFVDGDTYRLGEPVRATVVVGNAGEPGLLVPGLDERTLTFYFGQPGTGVRMRRSPVLPQGVPSLPRVLGPQERASREFLFTRLTGEAGQWGLMVALSGAARAEERAELLTTAYSRPVEFRVTDEVMLERDPYSGLITREQALALARERGGLPGDAPLRAVLVPLAETGLFTWVVFRDGGGGLVEGIAGCTVNPYSGVVSPLEMGTSLDEGKKE